MGRPEGTMGSRSYFASGNFPVRTLAPFHMGITHEMVLEMDDVDRSLSCREEALVWSRAVGRT